MENNPKIEVDSSQSNSLNTKSSNDRFSEFTFYIQLVVVDKFSFCLHVVILKDVQFVPAPSLHYYS